MRSIHLKLLFVATCVGSIGCSTPCDDGFVAVDAILPDRLTSITLVKDDGTPLAATKVSLLFLGGRENAAPHVAVFERTTDFHGRIAPIALPTVDSAKAKVVAVNGPKVFDTCMMSGWLGECKLGEVVDRRSLSICMRPIPIAAHYDRTLVGDSAVCMTHTNWSIESMLNGFYCVTGPSGDAAALSSDAAFADRVVFPVWTQSWGRSDPRRSTGPKHRINLQIELRPDLPKGVNGLFVAASRALPGQPGEYYAPTHVESIESGRASLSVSRDEWRVELRSLFSDGVIILGTVNARSEDVTLTADARTVALVPVPPLENTADSRFGLAVLHGASPPDYRHHPKVITFSFGNSSVVPVLGPVSGVLVRTRGVAMSIKDHLSGGGATIEASKLLRVSLKSPSGAIPFGISSDGMTRRKVVAFPREFEDFPRHTLMSIGKLPDMARIDDSESWDLGVAASDGVLRLPRDREWVVRVIEDGLSVRGEIHGVVLGERYLLAGVDDTELSIDIDR